MQLYLVMSFPDGWGGVARTMESMKIHLAEQDIQHHSWPMNGVEKNRLKLRILISYHYYQNTDLDELFEKYFPGDYPDVFCDSGAYSAHSQGVKIDIDAYAEWVKRYNHLFTTYANLDDLGDATITLQNQRYLEDKELNPLPVFHVGEDFKILEDYISEYQYIALGGMVPHMRYTKRIMPWIIKCFKIANGRSVFHGFGATSWRVTEHLPWYSVDSSSWGSGFRFGRVPLFDINLGRFYTVRLGNYKEVKKHSQLIKSLGFNPLDFADRERNDRAKICAISAISYMLAEQWLRRKHGEIKIPGLDGSEGLRSHLVTAASSNGDGNIGGNMSINALGQAGLKVYGASSSAVEALEAMSCRQIGTSIYLAGATADIQDILSVNNIIKGNDLNE